MINFGYFSMNIKSISWKVFKFVASPIAWRYKFVLSFVLMFEIIFDYPGHLIKRNTIEFIPIFKYIKDLINSGPEMRVWSKKMSHQILHLLTDFPFSILYIGVNDAKLSLLLERMKSIVQNIEYTSQHPDINSIINWILQVEINHLWWSIH